MNTALVWLVVRLLALAIPAGFCLGAATAWHAAPLRWANVVATTGFALAIGVTGCGALASMRGTAPVTTSSLGLRLDAVTSLMLLLVCTIALVIARYSRRYLDGDPGRRRYARWLSATLAAVTLLVLSGNLLVIAIAWAGTSLALHQLLTFYTDRTPAIVAAHKKFLVSRIADASLLGGISLIYLSVKSVDLDAIDAWVSARATLPPSLHVATVLIVVAVCLKSAQLPFHGWLTQVMEAPTPVSALLHAGIVNIGGFVMIRLAPLMAHARFAQGLLVVVGTTTAFVAALVTTTRVSVKVALAWSTCSQMGLMLVECGLGAWHLALLHLVAHSLYKAHAFLSSGGAVDAWRVHALAHQRTIGWRSTARIAVRLLAAASLYVVWHQVFRHVVLAPKDSEAGPLLLAFVVAAFGGLLALQLALKARPDAGLARALHPILFAGLYLDERFTRLTFRIWPPRLSRGTTPRAAFVGTVEASP